MSQTLSPSVARCYGLARVARVWKVSRASVYRSLRETQPTTIARRPGPIGACSDAELADHIRRQIDASRFHGEGSSKLWARLRFAGVRASPRRVRRVMRENGLLAPHRVGRTETVRGGGIVGHWSGGDLRPRRSKIQPVVRHSFVFWTKGSRRDVCRGGLRGRSAICFQ